MGILDRLSGGAEKVAKEAEKVFEQGRTKVEELQLERQMDVLARKLGYLELDTSRGRSVEPGRRQELLDELVKLEEQLGEMKTQTAAAQEREAGGEMAEVARVEQAAAAAGVAPSPVEPGAEPVEESLRQASEEV